MGVVVTGWQYTQYFSGVCALHEKNSSFVVYPQFWRWWFGLVETASSEVVGDNDVSHRVEHELHVLCICGAGHMTVDLFGG